MPKHQSKNPLLQEVYDHLRDIEGIWPIDGRSTDNIGYKANVSTLTKIYDRINKIYGDPTKDDWYLDHIEWKVSSKFRIHINKAESLNSDGCIHSIYVWEI